MSFTGLEIFYLLAFVATGVAGLYWKWGGEIGKVRDDLAAHKLHTAETFVTKAGMQEQTNQIMRSIEGIGDKIDKVNDRIDRWVEHQGKPVTRARS
ncbi:hypothetical protein [Phyllobacterium meliloti]|uniref:hypothetical protein n=1 Tax=Phyllobacterium meliloti TaxID=555317 RepID=UPI001D13FF8F|nr:hypothetical protein [Phyllobacterium sp. T1293]UGX87141.1 hypothetical protein LLE53_004650 [Phyllobacterium sp. T1293]